MPLPKRVERDAASFVHKLKTTKIKEAIEDRKGDAKAIRHSQRTLWLIGRGTAPNRLKREKSRVHTMKQWRKGR